MAVIDHVTPGGCGRHTTPSLSTSIDGDCHQGTPGDSSSLETYNVYSPDLFTIIVPRRPGFSRLSVVSTFLRKTLQHRIDPLPEIPPEVGITRTLPERYLIEISRASYQLT